MPLLIIPVLVILALIALVPISIVQRYRVGTSRQRARGWIAAINLAGLSLSAVLFLVSAVFTNIWVPDALRYTVGGLAAGCLLGITGLWLTRWEPSIGALHYTPNRLLVLSITLLVAARVFYGFWRGWESWRAGVSGESWFVAAGVASSMAAGAVVIGYYLTYWIGVRRRLKRQLASPVRRI
jgi:ABC-type cobalt transport system substrate-binding protein